MATVLKEHGRRLPGARRLPVALCLFGVLGLFLLGGGCSRFRSGTLGARDDLALVPRETAGIFMLNVKQARGSKLWQRLMDLREKDATAKKEYQDFISKCGLDPLQQIDSLFLALPENAQESREYALLLRGHYAPEQISACAKRVAQESGKPLTEAEYGGIKYLSAKDTGPALAVLGKRAVVIAGPAWLRRVIDLHTGKAPVDTSARDNPALLPLFNRTRTSDAFFWAGRTSAAMQERLRGLTPLGAAASLQSSSGSVDIAKGLAVHADLDFASEQDAASISAAANQQLASLKQDGRVQLFGLSSYLDTVRFATAKNTVAFDLRMTDQQLDDLITRLSGILKSVGATFGGSQDQDMPRPGSP